MWEKMKQTNKELLENIKNSISETVKEKKIGIAFSGGVDIMKPLLNSASILFGWIWITLS